MTKNNTDEIDILEDVINDLCQVAIAGELLAISAQYGHFGRDIKKNITKNISKLKKIQNGTKKAHADSLTTEARA